MKAEGHAWNPLHEKVLGQKIEGAPSESETRCGCVCVCVVFGRPPFGWFYLEGNQKHANLFGGSLILRRKPNLIIRAAFPTPQTHGRGLRCIPIFDKITTKALPPCQEFSAKFFPQTAVTGVQRRLELAL